VTKELTRLGLRIGGKPVDRARRLMETKGKKLADLDTALLGPGPPAAVKRPSCFPPHIPY
jgi:hypothetical protein